jgi:hypothetical protein
VIPDVPFKPASHMVPINKIRTNLRACKNLTLKKRTKIRKRKVITIVMKAALEGMKVIKISKTARMEVLSSSSRA